MVWTHFWDMSSGGTKKLEWPHIFINTDQESAERVFCSRLGRDPGSISCECCGPDYVITEYDTLEVATAYLRGLRHVSPLADDRFFSASHEERLRSLRSSRYLEPHEEIPEGWSADIRGEERGITLNQLFGRGDALFIWEEDIEDHETMAEIPEYP